MKALRLIEFQKPPEMVEVDVPEPGPGEVLVRIGGSGACHSDLHVMQYPAGMMPWKVPFTLGHEPAGWVEQVGPGVEGVEVGEAVAVYGAWGCGRCSMCRRGLETLCHQVPGVGAGGAGLGRDGGMAEFMVVPSARYLVPIGDMDPAEAAPLCDAGLTSYRAIKRHLSLLLPGSTVAIIGVGGLGHVAVQLVKVLSPSNVVAVDVSEEKRRLAERLGADASAPPEQAPEVVEEVSKGRGAELVLDIVGSNDTMGLAARLVGRLGVVALVGLALGSFSFNFLTVPSESSLTTCYWGSIPELFEVIELGKSGKIRVEIERFPLDRAAEAYRKLEAGEILGRAVIQP